MKRDTVEVLYVEDDAADVDFAQTALHDIACDEFKLHVVTDGEEAVKYLDKKTPHMVLLDLNIPKLHGKDLLRLIKNSDQLKKTPVVVLSTSQHQIDIDESYSLGAAGYFTKPANYEQYKGIFQAICDYWAHNVTLPSR